jgi:hypothetical protein
VEPGCPSALEVEDVLEPLAVILEGEALNRRPWDVPGRPGTHLQRVGDERGHDGEPVPRQREVEVRVAASIVGRLIRRSGFRLRRGATSAPVQDDLDLVGRVQRLLEGLDEFVTPESIVGDDAQSLGPRPGCLT